MKQARYQRVKALASTLPRKAPRGKLTPEERKMCALIAERRELPVSVVIATAEEAIANPNPEPIEAIAERLAYRRQVTVAEVYRQGAEVVERANRGDT